MNNLKRILATFIITSSIFIGTNSYANSKIIELKEQQGLRDSEIARLEGVIKGKDNDIKQISSKLNEDLEVIQKQKQEIDGKNAEIEKLKQQVNFKNEQEGSGEVGRKLNVEITAYIANCSEGCTGITATGIDIRGITTYQGHRIVATDPNIIPLNSIMRIDVNGQSFTAISLDTGGAIKGHIVDFLVGSKHEAINFGRQQATITIIREGK